MGNIDRGSLPQNFLDSVTNQSLLLPTPEPQYLFAHWAMAGRMNFAAMTNGNGAGVRDYAAMLSGGGAEMPAELDRLVRVAEMYPDFVQAIDDFGVGQGDTIKFQRNVYNSAGTSGYTKAVRKLNSDVAISTTGQTVKMEDVPVILDELHGPINSAGTAVAPYAIRQFDAKYRANRFQLASVVGHHLKRDYVKTIDTIVRDEFRQTSKYTTSDGVAVSAMTAGAGHGHNLETWIEAQKQLSDREWQPFASGRYVALVDSTFNKDMIQDQFYTELSKNHPEKNQLFKYIGSVQNMDFFECSTLYNYAAATTVPDEGSTVPSSVSVHESLLIGPGAVGFGTALAPEARFDEGTNYQTVAKVIWYALHAIQMVDERGVQRVLTQEG